MGVLLVDLFHVYFRAFCAHGYYFAFGEADVNFIFMRHQKPSVFAAIFSGRIFGKQTTPHLGDGPTIPTSTGGTWVELDPVFHKAGWLLAT